MNTNKPAVDMELEALQHDTFSYFLHETNPHNGLVRDKTASDWPASIAATGLALAGYPIVVERGLITRASAIEESLPRCDFSGPARKAQSRALPAITGFTIIFSMYRPADALGTANCRLWTAPFCSAVR